MVTLEEQRQQRLRQLFGHAAAIGGCWALFVVLTSPSGSPFHFGVQLLGAFLVDAQLAVWRRTKSRQNGWAVVFVIPFALLLLVPFVLAIPAVTVRVSAAVALPILAVAFWSTLALAANRYLSRKHDAAPDLLKLAMQVLAVGGLCLAGAFAAVGKVGQDTTFGMDVTCQAPNGAVGIPADNGSTFTVYFDQQKPSSAVTVQVIQGHADPPAPAYWRVAHFRYYIVGSTLNTSLDVLAKPIGTYVEIVRRVLSFGELAKPTTRTLSFTGLNCTGRSGTGS